MLKKFLADESGSSTLEILIAISVLSALTILAGSILRGGVVTGASTVSGRLNSYATGGSW